MSSTFFIFCNGFTGTWLFPLPIQIWGFNVNYVFAGKDATDDFDDVGHSTSARAMMDEYYVGDFDKAFIPAKTAKYTPPKQPHYNPDKTSDFIIRLLQFLVPLLILGLAFVVRTYTKSPTT